MQLSSSMSGITPVEVESHSLATLLFATCELDGVRSGAGLAVEPQRLSRGYRKEGRRGERGHHPDLRPLGDNNNQWLEARMPRRTWAYRQPVLKQRDSITIRGSSCEVDKKVPVQVVCCIHMAPRIVLLCLDKIRRDRLRAVFR